MNSLTDKLIALGSDLLSFYTNITRKSEQILKKQKGNTDKIFKTFPIQRAVETAEVINSFLNKKIEIEENFKEMKMLPLGRIVRLRTTREVFERMENMELKPFKT